MCCWGLAISKANTCDLPYYEVNKLPSFLVLITALCSCWGSGLNHASLFCDLEQSLHNDERASKTVSVPWLQNGTFPIVREQARETRFCLSLTSLVKFMTANTGSESKAAELMATGAPGFPQMCEHWKDRIYLEKKKAPTHSCSPIVAWACPSLETKFP